MPCKDEENAVKEEGVANDGVVDSPPVEGWQPEWLTGWFFRISRRREALKERNH
jgi:hypothetical protein